MGIRSAIFGELVTAIGVAPDAEAAKTNTAKLIELDANLGETFTTSSRITDHPIEDGSNISDHIIDDPDEIQIEGIITNTPLGLAAIAQSSSTRAEDLYSNLMQLKSDKTLVSVFTSKGEYEDMLIKSITRPRSPTTGDSAQFTIVLRKIKKIQSETVDAPQRTTKKKKTGLSKKPKTPTASAGAAGGGESLAVKAKDAILGWIR